MTDAFDVPARIRIEQFLKDYPVGDLHAITGYTSMAGLAWLARNAPKRSVTIVVGDLRGGFNKFKASDAAEVAEFLKRRDVQLLNWYRTDKSKKGAAIAHSKVFAAEGPAGQPFAVLAGSANLTNTGLGANVETMVEAVHGDRDVVFKQILALESEGRDSAAKILAKTQSKELIEASARRVYRKRPVWQEKAKPKKSARSGCLPALVPSIVWCLIPA